MYDIERLTLRDMTECGAALQQCGIDSHSMEEAARRIVRYLYEQFHSTYSSESAFVLARFFKTHQFAALSEEMQSAARSMLGQTPEHPAMKCLTLLGTVGMESAWNRCETSQGHKAIPLPNAQAIADIPMVAQLIRQLGLDVGSILNPDPALIADMEQNTYNVFYVPEAVGSPYVPAQESFVIPYGVRSVLGLGGVLQTGDIFAIILFSRVHIPPETARLFKPLAVRAKMAVYPFSAEHIFSLPRAA